MRGLGFGDVCVFGFEGFRVWAEAHMSVGLNRWEENMSRVVMRLRSVFFWRRPIGANPFIAWSLRYERD